MVTNNISTIYKTVNESSERINEANDCAVIAMSITTGKSYTECHEAFKKAGRQDRRGVSLGMIENVIKQFGIMSPMMVCQSEFRKRIPVTQAPRYFRDGKYIAITRSHALAVVDGVVHDWTNGRRHQIKYFYKID